MKKLSLIIALVVPLLFSISIPTAYAETGMAVSVNADEGSTTISVSGHTSVKNNDITIMVQAPNGNIISVHQVSPDANGDFMKDVQRTSAQSWKQDGMYTIDVKQGSSTLYHMTFQVEIVNGYTAATSVSESTLESGTPGFVDGPIGINELVITADAVQGSKIIVIIGNTDRTNTDVTIMVTSPNGNILSVDQRSPDANGDFIHEIEIDHLWSQNGYYTITAQQGESSDYKDSIQIEVVDRTVGDSIPIPEPESRLPTWVKNIFIWYAQDKISEDEIINALQFLIRQGTIIV